MVSLGYPYRNLNQVLAALKEKYGVVANPPSRSPSASFPPPPYSNIYQKRSSLPPPPSTSGNRISPAVLFIIVILAVIFFISGLLHLLVRFLIKKPSSASSSRSNRYPDISGSDALQRQLQQLFHLHDSGLDQAVIDALPVFVYEDIVGLKEPFDCAVCLCEFLEQDKLRLLPVCSHAFHINCIDTWLLSNSTCPLCRGALFTPGLAIENPVFDFNDSREEDRLSDDVNIVLSTNQKSIEMEEIVAEKRVFPVRLGKYRSLNEAENGPEVGETSSSNEAENGPEVGETSSSNLDARRCYSMGSFQYVVGDAQLQVALCQENGSEDKQPSKSREVIRNSQAEVDLEGKKLCNGRKGESFSVSKIWLWPKKGKFPNLLDTRTGLSSNTHQIPVWIGRTQE